MVHFRSLATVMGESLLCMPFGGECLFGECLDKLIKEVMGGKVLLLYKEKHKSPTPMTTISAHRKWSFHSPQASTSQPRHNTSSHCKPWTNSQVYQGCPEGLEMKVCTYSSEWGYIYWRLSMDHSLPGHLGSIRGTKYCFFHCPLLTFLFPVCQFQTKESRFNNHLTPTSGTKSGSTSSYNRSFKGFYSNLFKIKLGICPIFDLKLVNRFLLAIPDGINNIWYLLLLVPGKGNFWHQAA